MDKIVQHFSSPSSLEALDDRIIRHPSPSQSSSIERCHRTIAFLSLGWIESIFLLVFGRDTSVRYETITFDDIQREENNRQQSRERKENEEEARQFDRYVPSTEDHTGMSLAFNKRQRRRCEIDIFLFQTCFLFYKTNNFILLTFQGDYFVPFFKVPTSFGASSIKAGVSFCRRHCNLCT